LSAADAGDPAVVRANATAIALSHVIVLPFIIISPYFSERKKSARQGPITILHYQKPGWLHNSFSGYLASAISS